MAQATGPLVETADVLARRGASAHVTTCTHCHVQVYDVPSVPES